jgi:hypothetical protein
MNAKPKKSLRLTERDITDYALNELSPKERLYVESMMIGCDETRQEVCDFLELSKMLEEGFHSESELVPMQLDESRRKSVLAHRTDSKRLVVLRSLATIGSFAACITFAVSSPMLLKKSGAAAQLAMLSSRLHGTFGDGSSFVKDGIAPSDVITPAALPSEGMPIAPRPEIEPVNGADSVGLLDLEPASINPVSPMPLLLDMPNIPSIQ